MERNYGGIIKLNRIKMGLKQEYLCFKTGISKSQISRIERNKEGVSSENLNLIFSAMGLETIVENIDNYFENDFKVFYKDIVYLQDYEKSYKIIRAYQGKIEATRSYVKYLLAEFIYNVVTFQAPKENDYMFIENYFEYLESYQIQLFYDYLGFLSYQNENYLSELRYYDKAFCYSGSEYSTAMLFFHMSVPLTTVGRLKEALEYAVKARDIFAKTVNIIRLTSVNFQIARIYMRSGNFIESQKLNVACIQAYTNLNMQVDAKNAYNNLIWSYIRANNYDTIIKIRDEALKILNYDHCVYFYISFAYYRIGNKKEAKKYIKLAKEHLDYPTQYMECIITAFNVYLSNSDNTRKEKYLIKANQEAMKINDYDLEIFTLEILNDFFILIKNTEKSNKCMKKILDHYKSRK